MDMQTVGKRKALEDLSNSMAILESSIEQFHAGRTAMYLVIASQLRLLLCDSYRGKDISLLTRVFEQVKLHPIWGGITEEQDEEWKRKFGHSLSNGLVFQMPAMVRFNGKGGSKVEVLFDEKRVPIDLNEWLDQMLFSKEITIGRLIKSVANKIAVHSDEDYDKTLTWTKSVKLGDEDLHIKFIVAIGEYILRILRQQISRQTV